MKDASFANVVEGLTEVFPEADGMEFTPESTLADLPDWDSMSSVNLQVYFQKYFDVEVPMDFLADETSLEELVSFLKSPISSEAV